MIIGVPREIKEDEKRVGLLPFGVRALVEAGHDVYFEQEAGIGAGVTDEAYMEEGAIVVDTVDEVFAQADLILKVKEPLDSEFLLIREGQVVFTFFHFAASLELTNRFAETGAIAIAYETVEAADGSRPLLIPMSEIAGRMAVQEGAKYLEAPQGGRGVLLGGLPGVAPADVLILGGGVVGQSAARTAAGIGATVFVLDIDNTQLRHLSQVMPPNVTALVSNSYNLEKLVPSADLLIGAVLLPGAKSPTLVTKEMLHWMKRGSVIIDVAVDQGGCVETMHPTTHRDPTYVVDGVVHCGVANLPGAVPRTATMALSNATFPYVLEIANRGWEEACRIDQGLAHGLNMIRGKITHRGVAETVGVDFHPLPFDVKQ